MGKMKAYTLKQQLTTVAAAVMIMLSVVVFPPTVVQAASSPSLTKTTRNIIEGSSYDINIKDKIKGSAYTWTSSDQKIATVNGKGVVKGIKKGTAAITCTIKAPRKTYTLTCKVSILKEAARFVINNKVSALNLSQVYDLNRTLIPSGSNEKTTWSTSDKTIASPDKNGKFTALKTGTVTITGTTTSGLKDTVTIKIIGKDGAVTTQEELDALLGSGVETITLRTVEEVTLTIPSGDYSTTKLVVDAPRADITNKGVFKSIDIKNIKPETWHEEASGNLLNVSAANARIIIVSGANASISIQGAATNITIENDGTVEELVLDSTASIVITGTAKQIIPVVANILNAKITSDIPLDLTSNQKITLILLAGAEGTKVTAANSDAKPDIQGTVVVVIVVADNTAAPTPSAGGGGGNPGGGDSGSGFVNGVKVTQGSGYTKFELQYSYKLLQSIEVKYPFIGSYTIDADMLTFLKNSMAADDTTIQKWLNTEDTVETYDNGVTVTVTGTPGDSTKTVELTYGLLSKSYEVTVENSIVTVNTGSTVYSISTGGEKELLITPSVQGVEFVPSF